VEERPLGILKSAPQLFTQALLCCATLPFHQPRLAFPLVSFPPLPVPARNGISPFCLAECSSPGPLSGSVNLRMASGIPFYFLKARKKGPLLAIGTRNRISLIFPNAAPELAFQIFPEIHPPTLNPRGGCPTNGSGVGASDP